MGTEGSLECKWYISHGLGYGYTGVEREGEEKKKEREREKKKERERDAQWLGRGGALRIQDSSAQKNKNEIEHAWVFNRAEEMLDKKYVALKSGSAKK